MLSTLRQSVPRCLECGSGFPLLTFTACKTFTPTMNFTGPLTEVNALQGLLLGNLSQCRSAASVLHLAHHGLKLPKATLEHLSMVSHKAMSTHFPFLVQVTHP